MKEQSENNASKNFLKTDGGKTKSNAVEIPSINLPKGGGAMKGIDEKFSVNAINGSASFSVPLPFSPARGASPSMSISYNSGSGNGIFGLGWNLSLGTIKRKTDTGLPQYLDSNESDTYLIADAEDLVPAFKKDSSGQFEKDSHGNYFIDDYESQDNQYVIRAYLPRIEGLFSKIERWTSKSDGRIKWRIINKDNITTLFGWSDNSIIADPHKPLHIFEWLPEFVFDDKGNCCQYLYLKEDAEGMDRLAAHNANRMKNGKFTYTNTYLSRVLYGNMQPYAGFGNDFPNSDTYYFETVFDYGTTNLQTEVPTKLNTWDYRPDAFSNYRSGFEIRTTRLCKRVLLFHHFKGENEYDGLVRSMNFEYNTNIEQDFTFLEKVTAYGYIKKQDGTYSEKKMPSLEYQYQKHEWNSEVQSVSSEALVHAPVGPNEASYQFVDLYNEGLSGILTEQASGWFYKHNLGVWSEPNQSELMFEQAKLVSSKPSFSGLGTQFQLSDLEGNGRKQLVSFAEEPKGYFELRENDWQSWQTFKSLPNVDFSDPNTRMMDLDGDGKPDLVISENNVFTWYASLGKDGFSPATKVAKSLNEEEGPNLVFSDEKQSVFLADMTGDGLTDIVRIRNGEVCYWPNLGYGKFGAKVNMDNAPVFDFQDAFNPSWIRLSDIDGSGTTDIIYLGKNNFTCWKNLSGNRFSSLPFELNSFPEIHNKSSVTVSDLLGNGVSCIVWSSVLPNDASAPLKYIDLLGGKKPHIMVFFKNNLGKEVSIEYTPSTKFYIQDKIKGNPWITKLHFPVHCISKTTTIDRITGHKYVNTYAYHHGYYDHVESEFRGFGMVEKTDAETFEDWVKTDATNIVENNLHQEPVVSRTWTHTGAYLGNQNILSQFEKDYWYHEYEKEFGPISHPEIILPDAQIIRAVDMAILPDLSAAETLEGFRSCKGMPLRNEIFAKDATGFSNSEAARKKQAIPFSVSTHNCVIEMLQPKGQNKHAVFVVKEREAINYTYERNAEDPRIAHSLNIELDKYGNVLESVAVVYPRKTDKINGELQLNNEAKEAQKKTIIIYTKQAYTNDIIEANVYRLRLPYEAKSFELKGVTKSNTYYSIEDFRSILDDVQSEEVLYHELDKPLTAGLAQRRLIEHSISYYYKNDLSGGLAAGVLESLALQFKNEQLVYNAELITDIYGTKVTDGHRVEGKFDLTANQWWRSSGVITFDKNNFYLPIRYTDPYGAETKVEYDKSYGLYIEKTTDALGNSVAVEHPEFKVDNKKKGFDYRVLAPVWSKDYNRNFSGVVIDEIGLVKATAVLGKGNQADDLVGFTDFTNSAEQTEIESYFQSADSNELLLKGKNLLKNASSRFVYNLDTYARVENENALHMSNGEPERVKPLPPSVVSVIARETHHRKDDGTVNPMGNIQIGFEYSSGSGEVVMRKAQFEPGEAKKVVVKADNSIEITTIDTSQLSPIQLRWVGNGRTINNNKGNAVKQYEPYFSVTWKYEDAKELVETGVTPTLYYDAAGRLVKTEMPNGTFSKVTFDSWKQSIYDANDTVSDSAWFFERTNRIIDATLTAENKNPACEKIAADSAALHANTPMVMHFDTLGRPILSIEHNKNLTNGDDEYYLTSIHLDTEGNLRSVKDARGNIVVSYKYDMLGNLVYQKSMDAGERWILTNILGSPLRTWDGRNHEFQYFYDKAHRPTHSMVKGGDGAAPLNHIYQKNIYGESELTANRANESALQDRNILGKVIQLYDTGGLVETLNFDFKGQALKTTRKLFRKYKETVNWIDANLVNDLESGSGYSFETKTDALGRITEQYPPDGSMILPAYNAGGLLKGESIVHSGASAPTVYIKDIQYNEKGQREKIIYGNDVTVKFSFDKTTFRLNDLESKRKNGDILQHWYYTYDAAGNITHIEDKAAPVQFFKNNMVSALSTYTYDALYRLRIATGRENNAAVNFSSCDNWNDKHAFGSLNPGDPLAVRDYTQNYQYDSVGNILEMKHQAAGGSWTRGYEYEAGNNRLKRTFVGDITNPANYTKYKHHAQHGFMEEMPHLEKISWNFKDEVVLTSRQHCTDDNIPVITYYQYDGSGQRLRKITENQASAGATPTVKDERIYISGYEKYIKHAAPFAGLERESLSLLDEGHRFVMIETRNSVNDGTEKELIRYQLHNHLGSASLELDGNGQVISYEEYHPFGTTAYQLQNATIKAAAKRYRYTGMERDEETGLEYHSARYYLPWLGRWLSADPIGIGDGVNVYRYVKNNPIMGLDPTGFATKEQFQHLITAALEKAKSGNQTAAGTAAELVLEGMLKKAGYTIIKGPATNPGSHFADIVAYDPDSKELLFFDNKFQSKKPNVAKAEAFVDVHDDAETLARKSGVISDAQERFTDIAHQLPADQLQDIRAAFTKAAADPTKANFILSNATPKDFKNLVSRVSQRLIDRGVKFADASGGRKKLKADIDAKLAKGADAAADALESASSAGKQLVKSLPMIGVGISVGLAVPRLAQAAEEDLIYEEQIKSMGEEPLFADMSVLRESAIIAGEEGGGELGGWGGAALGASVSWETGPGILLGTLGGAVIFGFAGDSVGGWGAGWLFDEAAEEMYEERMSNR